MSLILLQYWVTSRFTWLAIFCEHDIIVGKGRKVHQVNKDLPDQEERLVFQVLWVQLDSQVHLDNLEFLDRQVNVVLCDKSDHQDPEVPKAFLDEEENQVQSRLLLASIHVCMYFIYLFICYLL